MLPRQPHYFILQLSRLAVLANLNRKSPGFVDLCAERDKVRSTPIACEVLGAKRLPVDPLHPAGHRQALDGVGPAVRDGSAADEEPVELETLARQRWPGR